MDLKTFQSNMYKRELRKLKTFESTLFKTELYNDIHHEDFGINRQEAGEIFTAVLKSRSWWKGLFEGGGSAAVEIPNPEPVSETRTSAIANYRG